MLVNILVAVVAGAQLVSGGVLFKRAPLSAAKLLEELSSLNGRDFCFNYIGAQVLVLPNYSTVIQTRTIIKTVTSRVSSTTTEVIGTLRKGTSTLTIPGGTITHVPEPSTVNAGITVTSVIVDTVYENRPPVTKTVYNPLRRRQGQDVPPEIADSDPVSISAACTKVINKYPIYTTEDQERTKSTTFSTTSTYNSTILKIQKSTVITPYSIKTINEGTVTVTAPASIATVTDNHLELIISTTTIWEEPNEPTTTVAVAACIATNALPEPLMIRDPYPYAGNTGSYDEFVTQHYPFVNDPRNEMQRRLYCCTWCWSLRNGGGGCLGYKFTMDRCTVYYKSTPPPVQSCPLDRIGVLLAGANESPENVGEFRPGPCGNTVRTCTQETVAQCHANPEW